MKRDFRERMDSRYSVFTVWSPGDPIQTRGVRWLIGTSEWSIDDFVLLEILERELAARNISDRIDVFDATGFTTDEQYQPYIPGMTGIRATTLAGCWMNGELIAMGRGWEARKMILEWYGIHCERPITPADDALTHAATPAEDLLAHAA